MQTVCELNAFRKSALACGMSNEDISDLIAYLAENPDAGEEMQGTGGCRKLRFSIRGNNKGKSGGVRAITFYTGQALPVFLISVFGKSQKISLTKKEANALKALTRQIVQAYSQKVSKLETGARP